MPLEQVRPILASDLAANCSSSAAHLEAALSIPDSRTSFAAAMSFLVSPTAMNGTGDSRTGVPPLMARSDAVAVDILWISVGSAPVCGVGAFRGSEIIRVRFGRCDKSLKFLKMKKRRFKGNSMDFGLVR